MKLGEFLNQVNTYAVTEGMDDQSLLRSIKHLLKGRALQWYTRSYLDLTTWEIFKAEIKQRFQGPNEAFTSFYRDLVAAFEIVEPSIPESEKLFILKSHLNSDFSPIAAASRSSSVRELVIVCKDFEVSRSYSTRGRASTARALATLPEPQPFQRPIINRMDSANRPQLNRQHFGTAQVNMIDVSQDEQEEFDPVNVRDREAFQLDLAFRNESTLNAVEEINALRAQTNWRGRPSDNAPQALVEDNSNRNLQTVPVCWQCENPGHMYMKCPNQKRFLFCYSCGKKGCTTRNCDACILRWRQLDVQNVSQVPGNRNWENSQ